MLKLVEVVTTKAFEMKMVKIVCSSYVMAIGRVEFDLCSLKAGAQGC